MLREAEQISSSQCSGPDGGIALTQTVEGAMDEMTTMLQRIRTLSVQAANGTNTSSDRASIQAEVTALSQEITRIACRTTFGGKKVLSGFGTTESLMTATTGKINFQVGSNHDDLQTLDMNIYKNDRSGTAIVEKDANGKTKDEFAALANEAASVYNSITKDTTKVKFNGTEVTLTGADAQAKKDDFLGKTALGVDKYIEKKGGSGTDKDDVKAKTWTKTQTENVNIFRDSDAAKGGYSLENLMKAVGMKGGKDTTTCASFVVGADGTTTGTGYTVFDVRTSKAAQATLASIDKVINLIDTKRGDFGALENRMSSTISNQTNIMNNESDARSRIRDTDYAEEASNLSAQSIVQQAASSMLTQANSLPQMALSLLG